MAAPLIRGFIDLFVGNRIFIQRLALLAALVFVLIAKPPGMSGVWWGYPSELAGFILLGAATFGRLWCLLFIGGAKNATLVIDGPYSVVRNPLYLFNLIGAAGLGLAVQQPLLAAALSSVFVLYYPAVVASEERTLLERFGDAYRAYQARTPRWLPRFSLYHEPEQVSIRPRWIRHGMLDAMWLLWAYWAWELLDKVRRTQVLSAWF